MINWTYSWLEYFLQCMSEEHIAFGTTGMLHSKLNTDYTVVLLAAGSGSRISNMTDLPKCFLTINGNTLLQRNFEIWEELKIKKVKLVLGYKSNFIRQFSEKYEDRFEISYVYNEDFKNKGNTYSLYLGIKEIDGPALIFDADLLYDPQILKDFIGNKNESDILVGPGSLDDIECTKTLINVQGFAQKTIDKRAITKEELEKYQFAGEAIGILKFSKSDIIKLKDAAELFLQEKKNLHLNWEHLLNQFLPSQQICIHSIKYGRWIEIDTSADYEIAQDIFRE